MNESIIDYLNGLLDLIGYFDKRYCLIELKSEGDNVYPVHYLANGDWEKITIDQNNGTTYWRKGDISSSKIQNDLTTDVLYQWTIPYRLVAYKRRGDVGTDNEYTADRLADVLTKQLTFVNGALRNTLKARKVEVTVSQRSTDSAAIYAEEYNPSPAKDIPFKYVVVALDVEVIVEGRRDCMDACPTDNDILHAFDFCNPSVIDRLTAAQQACLTTELCGAADPATLEINGVEIADIASGATRDQEVHDTAGSDVGSNSSGEWVVGDTTVENNATPTWTTTGVAESTITLAQAKMLDSDGVTEVLADYIPSASGTMFTATPCAAIPSIAVALDDSTPVIGDEIIITVTPTNTTPTEYIYIVEYNSTMELLEYSASPTCNWTVSISGAFEIFVLTNESGTKKVYNSATGTATGFLFDNYGTADAVGYSFDRLRGAYSGPIVTIRRSSDNAEEDFYLNASNTFDMTSETSGGTSLSTWIGSDSGYITTRYDQGLTAKHRTQTTQAAQPLIVDAGTLVTRGGKAALYYDGTDDEFISAAAIGEADVDCWYIFEPDADTIYIHQHSSGSAYGLYCRDGNTSTTIHSNYGSPTFRADGAAITIANRNEAYDKTTPRKLVAHLGADLTLWSTYDVGYYGGGGLSSTGWEQDYIIYPSGGTSAGDITGIEDDINTRFSLY